MNKELKKLAGWLLVAVVYAFGASFVFGQEPNFKKVTSMESVKIRGIVARRDPDRIIMKDLVSPDVYYVELTPSTVVKTYRKGLVRGSKEYPASYLLRGLRIEVEGRGSANGYLISEYIRFNEEDLKTAQALEVRMDPYEQQTVSNTERIGATEENQKRMAGQIEENAAVAAAAKAQADAAMAEANRANNRINGLDEFEEIRTISVPFAVGSSTLGPKGRATIDEAAAWVKTQNTKGWMVAIVGFADSTGNTAKNKALSERRANAVIGYLVAKHNLQLTRLVQPFGAGEAQPAATNATAEGRAKNRRVEIRLLVNKGIAGD